MNLDDHDRWLITAALASYSSRLQDAELHVLSRFTPESVKRDVERIAQLLSYFHPNYLQPEKYSPPVFQKER
jgi:hypothetical protein